MTPEDFEPLLGPLLAKALAERGYTELTPVQQAVLDPALAGRDLRITSQTGSGKTLAIGFALRDWLRRGAGRRRATGSGAAARAGRRADARAGAPGRGGAELALRGLRRTRRVRGRRRRLPRRARARSRAGLRVVVGTPGRLLDHLRRGAIDPSGIAARSCSTRPTACSTRLPRRPRRDPRAGAAGRAAPCSCRRPSRARCARSPTACSATPRTSRARASASRTPTSTTCCTSSSTRQKVDAIVNLLLADPEGADARLRAHAEPRRRDRRGARRRPASR